MKVIIVEAQNGHASWVEEAPSQHVRQWRNTQDGTVIPAPATPADIDHFYDQLAAHAAARLSGPVHIHEVHT